MMKIFPAVLAASAVLFASAASAALTSGEITIWVKSDKNYDGIARVGELFTAQSGTKVKVEHPADLEDLAPMFVKAAGAGGGPDIIMWAHDRFGEWVESGLLAPLDVSDAVKSNFADFSWEAMTVNGKIYGYPMSIEALSLICNKALVPKGPGTFEYFATLDSRLKGQGARAILWDYNQVYYTYLLMAAGGGFVFRKVDGVYDVEHTGINNEGSKAAVNFLVDMLEKDQLQKNASYGMADSQFMEGKLGCVINGPWSWAGYDQAGIDFGVYPLPTFGGNQTKSFVGVQGLAVNAASPNKVAAVNFIENYLLTDEGLQEIIMDKDLGMAALKSFESMQEQDERIAVTMENATAGEVMPSTPKMSEFWTIMNSTLQKIFTGQQKTDEALAAAEQSLTAKAQP